MKKLFYFGLLILLTFFSMNSVNATKGCCSSHGGVNCSKIQSNGKVVCNDGWTGSSCSYSSMAKCQGYSPSSGNKNTYIYGCTDINSINYNSKANKDDDSCIKKIYGCMNKDALNYDSDANISDNSCKYKEKESISNNDKSIYSNDKSNNQSSIIETADKDDSGAVIVGSGILGTIGVVIYLITKKKV